MELHSDGYRQNRTNFGNGRLQSILNPDPTNYPCATNGNPHLLFFLFCNYNQPIADKCIFFSLHIPPYSFVKLLRFAFSSRHQNWSHYDLMDSRWDFIWILLKTLLHLPEGDPRELRAVSGREYWMRTWWFCQLISWSDTILSNFPSAKTNSYLHDPVEKIRQRVSSEIFRSSHFANCLIRYIYVCISAIDRVSWGYLRLVFINLVSCPTAFVIPKHVCSD